MTAYREELGLLVSTQIMYSVLAKEENILALSLYRLRFSLSAAREGHFKERVILAV